MSSPGHPTAVPLTAKLDLSSVRCGSGSPGTASVVPAIRMAGVVEDTFEIARLFDHQCGGPVQGWPGHQEGQGADRAAGLLDVVKGLFFGFDVVEIGKSLQIRAEMGRRQGTLETVPPELLCLIGSPERFQRIDPGVLPREFVPGRLSLPGVLRRPVAVGGTQRQYQPVPCRFRHAWLRDNRSVGR